MKITYSKSESITLDQVAKLIDEKLKQFCRTETEVEGDILEIKLTLLTESVICVMKEVTFNIIVQTSGETKKS